MISRSAKYSNMSGQSADPICQCVELTSRVKRSVCVGDSINTSVLQCDKQKYKNNAAYYSEHNQKDVQYKNILKFTH